VVGKRGVTPTFADLLSRGAPRSPDRDSLEAWGRALGAVLPRPACLAFEGDLGAGKTTLVRAIAAGLGVRDLESVTSPTFSLVQEYDAPRGPVVHVDLYRLRSPAELEALGWEEIVDRAPVLLVEWPDRAFGTLPSDTITVSLSHDADNPERRLLKVMRPGPR
jgi:tRNA threonylcarbamoyl adenosine modification protein YjeE